MKKLLFLIAPLMLLIASCTKGGDYKISITFPDDTFNGKTAYLTSYDSGDTLDNVIIENKCVLFNGHVDTAYFARLIVDGKRLGFIVEPGQITIDWTTGLASGAKQNDALNALYEQLEGIEKQYDKYSQDFRDGKLTEDQVNAEHEKLEHQELDYLYQAYNANRDNAIGPWALNQWLMSQDFTISQLDSLLNTTPSYYKGLTRMKRAISDVQARENTAVGKHFTDFEVKTHDGQTAKLSDFAGKGEIVVVDFWASWCGPCRVEIEKSLKPIYTKYNGKELKVIGIAVWDKPEDTLQAIDALEIPWDVIVGDHYMTEQTDLYGIAGIPHIMIIDGDGIIISRGLQADKLTDFVDNIMKK